MVRTILQWLRQWWECRTKRCDYYQHYLAYGPKELEHEGYHAAVKHCLRAQLRLTAWMDAHPDMEEPPRGMLRTAATWEQRIRA